MHVLDDIPFTINRELLYKTLRVKENSEKAAELDRLVQEAQSIGRPRGLYREAYIDRKDESAVVIDGITFSSRILRINLETAERVFPFVATCGRELEDWARSIGDMLLRFFADSIQSVAMGAAIRALNVHLREHYHPGKISVMSPGSLKDWPISEQSRLFQLLGDTKELIGVEINESFCMMPLKSVSGIQFPTEVSFESCQLCRRENCPGRRAPYDSELHEVKYGKL